MKKRTEYILVSIGIITYVALVTDLYGRIKLNPYETEYLHEIYVTIPKKLP